ncbi:hypothetical protein OK348_10865 [Flavobacterium sp. MXW15]|uniref:X-Tfes XVIPCD domain-containing protein n=1 Tax=Xanthomonas chitinilytica TaxID=2989819 RepID=A0ABT3JY42_9XANT|nr:XVIPCD domain-containing protein [Xanthomonas sp. H13-6]MCW4455293.1 hypothetical protein [Flavobacterium sp. MXW15]MCW4473120.1 hypothetical protein [Xanthomonas sp. H13-6]
MLLKTGGTSVIEANIASGPAAIAADYQQAYRRNGWRDFGEMPQAVHTALDPDTLQAANGRQYRRDAQGQWRHDDETAQGNTALELEATRTALQPALARHAEAMAAMPGRDATDETRQREAVLYQYRLSGTELKPDWQEAVILATQRTRQEHGLAPGGMTQLQPNAQNQIAADSPIAHLQADAGDVGRIVAVTSTQDVLRALDDVRARGHGEVAPPQPSSGRPAEAATAPERDVRTQAPREAGPSQESRIVRTAPTQAVDATAAHDLAPDSPGHIGHKPLLRIRELVREAEEKGQIGFGNEQERERFCRAALAASWDNRDTSRQLYPQRQDGALKEAELSRIDHFVVGTKGYAFLVQGSIDDPASKRVPFDIEQAKQTPVEASDRKLEAATQEVHQQQDLQRQQELARGADEQARSALVR